MEKGSANMMNSAGYCYLARGDYDQARQYFETARNSVELPELIALVDYNIACVDIMAGNRVGAVERLKDVEAQMQTLAKRDRIMACVFVPRWSNGAVLLEESTDPDLLEKCRESLAWLNEHPV